MHPVSVPCLYGFALEIKGEGRGKEALNCLGPRSRPGAPGPSLCWPRKDSQFNAQHVIQRSG